MKRENCWPTTAFALPTSASPSSVPHFATVRVCDRHAGESLTLRTLTEGSSRLESRSRPAPRPEWRTSPHHDVVTCRLEPEREERATFALAAGQIASAGLDSARHHQAPVACPRAAPSAGRRRIGRRTPPPAADVRLSGVCRRPAPSRRRRPLWRPGAWDVDTRLHDPPRRVTVRDTLESGVVDHHVTACGRRVRRGRVRPPILGRSRPDG